MRGSPLLRALLAFLAIFALGYPLRQVTRARSPEAAEAAPLPVDAVRPVVLQVTFTTPPAGFTVKHLAREVWQERAGAATAERKLEIPYPAEGVELQFAAAFPEGAPLAAVRLILTDPAGETHEKTVWGSGSIDEVVSFP